MILCSGPSEVPNSVCVNRSEVPMSVVVNRSEVPNSVVVNRSEVPRRDELALVACHVLFVVVVDNLDQAVCVKTFFLK